MAPNTAETPRRLLRDGDIGEPMRVLVAGTSATGVFAAFLLEAPATNAVLWSLLFIPATLAGYHYREKGIAVAAVLGLASIGIVALRPDPNPAIILPFAAMIALASLASTLGYSVERERVRRREALELAPGGAFLLSRRDAAIEDANGEFAEHLGYTGEEMQDLPVSKIWPYADDRARFLGLAEPGGKTAVVETRFVGRDGVLHRFILSGRSLDDETILCRAGDITRYREVEAALKAEHRRLLSVLDTLPAYVILLGEDHTFRYANRAFRETFGDPEGRPCYEVQRGSRRPCNPCRGTLVFTLRSPQRWEWDHTANGKTYEVHAYPFTDTDGTDLMLQLGVDITQRVQAEEALKGIAGNLQAKNRELEVLRSQLCVVNQDLDEMVRERTADVEKLLAQKDEFISQLGHDLKTPLTPLVALMPRIIEREQDPSLRRLLEIAGHNVTYMKDLVQKTLQLARMNSLYIELDLEPLDLRAELESAIRNYTAPSRAKAITLANNVPPGLVVRADRVLLGEVFNNLLANAVKYMQNETGTITVDAARDGKTVLVSVRDTGIGMTREQLEKAFIEFYKADTSRHDLESPGLGLTICRRIVERHGGRIWAESDGEGRGSTIIFTLEAIDGP
ncbi:PAS domain-containing sensor histidine kinase [Methanoculleus sp. Wushi-C6]|uniref:histidine kinase n=1 Tax=Methanoculleus caldifontis TaxID=2651577 RepID=A0ABU3WY15_9EURY|nr:PAS domain-containing sensor histidine kinase [Methanoculleus sp. Wushi-C6]MDV2480697.1 PAS domain-containing sensor histidine kinase [Methanoculleus sp. Wushi-C6]